MTKKNYAFMVLTVAGVLLFGLGMCMCLIQEWNAFRPGVIVTALGAAALLALAVVRWAMAGNPVLRVNGKWVARIAYCVVSLLVLGTGMAMVTAIDGLLLPGIVVGVVGLMMALGMVPLLMGMK